MCWTSASKPESLIADQDVLIFKIGRAADGYMFSPYRHFPYKLGSLYRQEVTIISNQFDGYHIDEGFHSYHPAMVRPYKFWHGIVVSMGGVKVARYGADMSIFEGFIPKGACYHLNILGEIVSDQIVITKKIR